MFTSKVGGRWGTQIRHPNTSRYFHVNAKFCHSLTSFETVMRSLWTWTQTINRSTTDGEIKHAWSLQQSHRPNGGKMNSVLWMLMIYNHHQLCIPLRDADTQHCFLDYQPNMVDWVLAGSMFSLYCPSIMPMTCDWNNSTDHCLARYYVIIIQFVLYAVNFIQNQHKTIVLYLLDWCQLLIQLPHYCKASKTIYIYKYS